MALYKFFYIVLYCIVLYSNSHYWLGRVLIRIAISIWLGMPLAFHDPSFHCNYLSMYRTVSNAIEIWVGSFKIIKNDTIR